MAKVLFGSYGKINMVKIIKRYNLFKEISEQFNNW